MPVVKYQAKLEKIFQKPIFKVEDLVNQGIPHNYAKKRLHELAKQGKIIRIQRNKYTVFNDPFIVAANLNEPSYLSFWSAMFIREVTTQIPFTLEVVTSRRVFNRKIKFNDTEIVFYKIKPQMMFGYENILRGDIRIPVAKKEKIIIDSLYFNKIPDEELIEILKVSDYEVLREYAKLTQKKKIVNAVEEMIKNVDGK